MHRYRFAALAALVVASAAVLVPLGSPTPAAAAPETQRTSVTAYDHSAEKGMPGTRGPLPKGFSRTRMAVKFRADRDVHVRAGQPVARDGSETAALRDILARYPGTVFTRSQPQSEAAVDAERERLEARSGRELPDLNSWFDVSVGGDIEPLLAELNALPSVELAMARPDHAITAPADPLQSTQVYRTGVSPNSGIDADFAHALPGGKGAGITITDVEAGGRDSAAQSFGSIASGDAHSLMVAKIGTSEVGTVRAWGAGSSGQLGLGTTTGSPVFMAVPGLTDVTAVAAGANFSMALKSDNTVWTWGANGNGQLGNGTTTNSTVPVQVSGLTSVTAIAAGGDFAVAVRSDGTMRAWGANASGQLGDGTTTQRLTPVTVSGVSGISTAPGAVAAGASHTLAVRTTGALQAWGANASGQLGRDPATTPSSSTALTVSGVSGATQVAAGSAASYARLSSGAVWSWGANASGQLGNGTTTTTFTPAAIPGLNTVRTVTAGGSAAAATLTDHSVRSWGLNSSGQLGTGGTTNASTPTSVFVSQGATQVAAGASQMLAVEYTPGLDTDPNTQTYVWAWGANGSGQLGTGNTTANTSPVRSAAMRNLWNTCHEDVATRPAPAGPPVRLQVIVGSPCLPAGGSLHGTASVGFVAADDDNGVGLNGLLPEARLQLVNGDDWQGSVALARTNSQPGDVIWFEVSVAGGPWEIWGPIYDEVVTATAAGITVVQPAGNGSLDLDGTDPWAEMLMGRPDSGSIIVGAGQPSSTMPWTEECDPADPHPAPRTVRDFSTYGTRVDVQGWGNCIASFGGLGPGRNDLTPTETDPNRMYWSNMNGTSGAAPMVVGAVGAVQGILTQSGPPLSPLEIRSLLKRTGAPQPATDTRHIGPLPDIRAAINDISGGVAAGTGHSLTLRSDGANGQLGDATTTNRPVRRRSAG
ncbi:S8 family serine peptidase [Actinophytocola xinjiangensis]|nr:S8 family serine peptidase [Actinophytocola xinjiangensis]